MSLIETKNGLRDEKQRTLTRIRTTKQGEDFRKEQVQRLELIENHYAKVLDELEYLQAKRREKFEKQMQVGEEWLS